MKITNKKLIYKYKSIISLSKYNFIDPNSKRKTYDYHKINLRNAVMIIVVNEKKEILLVKQFRPGIKTNTYELPGGMIEKKEKAEQTAKRELFEETGIYKKKLKKILKYYRHSGYHCGSDTIFLTNVEKVKVNIKRKNKEILSLSWLPLDRLLSSQINLKFKSCGIIASILFYKHYLEK